MSETPSASRGLKGRDLITVGIFTALYFVINFLFMLLSGLHPYLWVFMPAIDALFAGIPFMLACAKVPKFGTVLIIGMVPSLIYFITGDVHAPHSRPHARFVRRRRDHPCRDAL